MDVSEQQRALVETIAARERAEALVLELTQAKEECERQMQRLNRSDAVKAVTGRSSIERAIDEAKRIVAVLDRSIAETRAKISRDAGSTGGALGSLAAAIQVAGAVRPRSMAG